jgi:hypothetical protein
LVDLLRPLSEAGVRPDRFSKIVLELQTKRHHKRAINREQQLRIRRQLDRGAEGELLSEFGDKLRYGGCVPTGQYFHTVLVKYGKTTRPHMDAEVCGVVRGGAVQGGAAIRHVSMIIYICRGCVSKTRDLLS